MTRLYVTKVLEFQHSLNKLLDLMESIDSCREDEAYFKGCIKEARDANRFMAFPGWTEEDARNLFDLERRADAAAKELEGTEQELDKLRKELADLHATMLHYLSDEVTRRLA